MKPLFYLIIYTALSGCSLYQSASDAFTADKVEAWERGVLARDDMQLDADPVRTFSDEHIYFSKEASTGGRGVGGGGCGCN